MKNSPNRIEELLYMLGGLEASILEAMDQRDWEFVKLLKVKKADYYERLRRVSYGLPEKRTFPTKTEGQ